MPRAGLNAERVVAAAAEMTDEVGPDQLTLAGLATRLGVRQPSLYKHLESLDGLHRSVALQARTELGEVLAVATIGLARDDAMIAMANAYRTWALQHPGRYRTTQRSPVAGDSEDERVSERTIAVIAAVVAGYGITGDDAIDAIRGFRAMLHGFVSLEIGGGMTMPLSIDRSFDRLVRAFIASLSTWGDGS